MAPLITFLISAHSRPDSLGCLLYSLRCQTVREWSAVVLDNSTIDIINERHVNRIMDLNDSRVSYRNPRMGDPYLTANKYLSQAAGDWLAFPNDDTYYVPDFIRIMTDRAIKGPEAFQYELEALPHELDLVYCDTLYDPRRTGRWEVLDVHPSPGRIDKTSFIVRRDKFMGFIPDPVSPFGSPCQSDGYTMQALADRLPHGKAPGVLVVHS